jgi:predicted adenylyl cyclase CyaB
MLRRNLEIKARCPDLAAARAVVRELVGRDPAIEHQCDTYFHVPHGRLKLREINGATAVLIAYARPDTATARMSQYHLVPIVDPVVLKAALSTTLGIQREVRKRREISLWHNVRIHLDEVEGLGNFVEFEAVLGPEEDAVLAQGRLDELCDRLQLHPDQFIAGSYLDMD